MWYLIPTDFSTARSSIQQNIITHNEISMSPGMNFGVVDVVYLSPDKGRVTVNLMNANDDVLIHIDARFDWYTWKNILVFNSMKAGGEWGEQIEAEIFPFPCCGMLNALRVEIQESSFVISANGVGIASYPYRENLGLQLTELCIILRILVHL